jgi:hypothetical protein
MLQAAARGIDEIIVFAGSEDLIPAVIATRDLGARVTIVSSMKTSQMMVSPELRSEADWFVDIVDIKDKFTRRERETYQSRELPDHPVVVEDRREAAFGVIGGGVRRETAMGSRARVVNRK